MKKTNGLRNIWYNHLSSEQRYFIRKMYYLPIDFMDKITGKSHKYVPPRGYIYTGSPASGEKYYHQGQHQIRLMQNYINLNSKNSVLDIGCGVGRSAMVLTELLDKNSRYEGFDVVKKGVDWCNKKIKKDFPNFNFTYVPLFNDLYNNEKNDASKFIFPYENSFFDKTFSFSVFTHMKMNEIENYFTEMNRVMKPNGLSLHTFFLYDETDAERISKLENFNFPVDRGNYKLMSDKVESANIAIHKAELHKMAERSGLEIVSIIDGFWKGERKENSGNDYQDTVVFKKK